MFRNNRHKPSPEQIKRWKQKEWEKNWDKELIEYILGNIKEQWKLNGTITAPNWEVLGYILEEQRIPYLLHCLLKLENEQEKIILIRKDGELYLDYIPF